MILLLILAALGILIGVGVGIYMGTVAFFLFTEQEQAEMHARLDRIDADIDALAAVVQP